MYPENKFEARLGFFDAIETIIGAILCTGVAGYTLWAMYNEVMATSFSAFWEASSWYGLVWHGLSVILILWGPYYLVTYIKNALSKGAYFRIDETGIFTKEDGFMPFDTIKDIEVVNKVSMKTGEKWADTLKVLHYDGSTTRCDIEDVSIDSEELIKAYDHFQKIWLKNQK